MKIKLIPYSEKLHLKYLRKWLTDEELMKGWGFAPFLKSQIAEWAIENERVILMIEAVDLNKIIGFANFYHWDKELHIASRGTLIDKKYQNQGYGKAAILASNRYAFKQMNLKRIELYIEDGNEISKHVTEKLNYKFDKYDPVKKRSYYYTEATK